MRLVMLVPRFPKPSETFIVGKFLGLLDRGHDVRVVCRRSDPADWDWFPQLRSRPGVRGRVHVGWPDRPRWRAALLLPALVARCLLANPRATLGYLGGRGRPGLRGLWRDAELVALGPDLVHFEFGALAAGRMDVADRLGCKVVVSFRGYDINYFGLDDPGCYDRVWERADGVHCLGEGLWGRARRRGCPADLPHALIPPAIDTDFFDPGPAAGPDGGAVGSAGRPLRVLSVGRLEWVKGYEYALGAIDLVRRAGLAVEYRVAGAGESLEAVAFCRHQLGLGREVELLGALPREAVREQMRWADVLLHAAVSEGFCNAVIEAQAMRLPVVCTDADGLPENVADGETGWVVPRRDPGALADRLIALAADPGMRRRMGEAGRRRALDRFRLADQVAAFEAFYERVAGGARRGPDRAALVTTRPEAVKCEVRDG